MSSPRHPKPTSSGENLVPVEAVITRIVVIRGHKVLLDEDIATLYEVETRALLQAVRRNPDRFPSDFMFVLTQNEAETLRSQNVIAKAGRGGRRSAPYAFTEQGVAMLSSVLRSKRAVAVNVEIMRAFVRLREALESQEHFARKLDDLERKSLQHDAALRDVFAAIKQLMAPPAPPKRNASSASVASSSKGPSPSSWA